MRDTKRRILDVSLELFSQNGFSAVSIRDICKEVHIKESSVYYHFTNKQAILNELLNQFKRQATDMMRQLEQGLESGFDPIRNHLFQKVCDAFFENYLMDEFCNKIMRLLSIEQFSSGTVQKIYDYWMFEEPLKFQSKVFAVLINAGVLPPSNSEYLAIKYYAPIYFFAQRWLFSGTLSEERKNAFRTDVYSHIQFFFEEIGGTVSWQTY